MTDENAVRRGRALASALKLIAPDAWHGIIAAEILTACEEEARETKAAVEAEREACATDMQDWLIRWCGYGNITAQKVADHIRSRGNTDALDEALRKARLEELGNIPIYDAGKYIKDRIAALQHPEGKG